MIDNSKKRFDGNFLRWAGKPRGWPTLSTKYSQARWWLQPTVRKNKKTFKFKYFKVQKYIQNRLSNSLNV